VLLVLVLVLVLINQVLFLTHVAVEERILQIAHPLLCHLCRCSRG